MTPSQMEADLLRSGLLPADMDAVEVPGNEFGSLPPGYAFPYYTLDGAPHPRMWRTRLYNPAPGKGKYTQPSKAEIVAAGGEAWEATLPYLYPHILAQGGQTWASLAAVKGKRVLMIEGEKKSVSGSKYVGRPAIGFAGAYAALYRPEAPEVPADPAATPAAAAKAKRAASRARAENAKRPFQLHPVLAQIFQPGDIVDVVFDADVGSNPDVARAAGALRQVLQAMGVKVNFVKLPQIAGGLDDWIMAIQDKALVPALFDALERTDGREFGTHHPTLYDALGLVLNAKDTPIYNLTNVRQIIDHHPDLRDRLWYDEVTNRVYENFKVGPRQISDATGAELTRWMQREMGLHHFTHTLVEKEIFATADNPQYTRNHILDAMTEKWDGTTRLETLFIEAFGAEDCEYTRMVGRMWAISAIARLKQPGCQVDTMLVLEGDQGVGKSKAMEILGGAGYIALQQKLDNKDFLVSAHTAWIVDMVELGAMKWADMETIKGLITTRTDSFRMPYGRASMDRPRRFVMVGSTNSEDYLRDETGNRRFWPIKCVGEINRAWLIANREQIWAEAMHRYMAGEPWWEEYSAATAAATRAIQDARVAEDPWEEMLAARLSDTVAMRSIDVSGEEHLFVATVELLHGLGLKPAEVGRYSKRLGAVMRQNKEWKAFTYNSRSRPIELNCGSPGKVMKARGYIRIAPNVEQIAPPPNVSPMAKPGKKSGPKF